MKIIICGSPQWSYPAFVEDEIVKLFRRAKLDGRYLLVIHGGEPGPEQTA